MKIILCLIKSFSPSESDEQNSAFKDPHGREQHGSADSFQKGEIAWLKWDTFIKR